VPVDDLRTTFFFSFLAGGRIGSGEGGRSFFSSAGGRTRNIRKIRRWWWWCRGGGGGVQVNADEITLKSLSNGVRQSL
jgi:hypothetical protein